MKKLISIFLAISLMLCIFAGCSNEKPSKDTNTRSTTEQQEDILIEAEDDTEETSDTTNTTETSETEKTTKTTETTTTSSAPSLQLKKPYVAHEFNSDECIATYLYFTSNGEFEIVIDTNVTEEPEYKSIWDESHEHYGVKYYLFDGTGYMSRYQVSGNKITTDDGTFTILSNSSIKRYDGVVFNIDFNNSRFE